MYLTLIFKTFVLYLFIIFVYRIMGKREVGELGVGDLIVTVLIAELAALSIESETKSILISIIPITILACSELLINYISLKNDKIRYLIDGKPSVIIKDGKIKFSVMTKLRYSLDDLVAELRAKGVNNIEDVSYAVLETNGELSVFQNDRNYPLPIILDGVIDYQTLREINKDKKWLDSLLNKKGVKLEDIFYAFYNKNKTFIIKKNELI